MVCIIILTSFSFLFSHQTGCFSGNLPGQRLAAHSVSLHVKVTRCLKTVSGKYGETIAAAARVCKQTQGHSDRTSTHSDEDFFLPFYFALHNRAFSSKSNFLKSSFDEET